MRREPDSPPSRTTGSEGTVPARVAFWLHRGAPGGDHVDLLIGPFDARHPPAPDERLARSWRLPVDAFPAEGGVPRDARWLAIPTAPHRMAYLMVDGDRDLDRDLGDGRGTARLLAWGDGWATLGDDRIGASATVARVMAARPLEPEPGIKIEIEIHRSTDGTTSAELRTPRGRFARA